MRIILDTNIWISFLIGKRLHTLGELLTRPDVSVYVCHELMQEFTDVARRPKIKKYVSEKDIRNTLEIMAAFCINIPVHSAHALPVRDPKDIYLLSLASCIHADLLVTGDNDLLVLKQQGETKIITFSELICIVNPGLLEEGDWNSDLDSLSRAIADRYL